MAETPAQRSIFNPLARRLESRTFCWAVVVISLLVAGVAGLGAGTVEQDDDLLAFLPHGDPDVQAFREINANFGGLEVALVGVEAAEGEVFAPAFLKRLRAATERLTDIPELSHVLGLTNVVDFVPDEVHGGIITGLLVQDIPDSAEAQARLERKVMSRDFVVGNLVSPDARGVLIYCFLGHGADPRITAQRIQQVVGKAFPDDPKRWGGAPFVGAYIFDTTQRDLRTLTPWAMLAIVLVIIISFRDLLGAFLALLTTAMGIGVSLGVMAALDVRFNIVLGGMPVILFALGSAYGIHLLSRYYLLVRRVEPLEALTRSLRGIGPTILAAGMTTAASLLSFVMMNIRPMQIFGLFTALGIMATLTLSLTFLPAVIRLLGLKRGRTASELALRRATIRLCLLARRHRLAVGVLLGLLFLAGLSLTGRVDTTVEPDTFYSQGSPPDQAADFLRTHFGGDQFLQVEVAGDMTSPQVLRELQRIADHLSLLPHVTSVVHAASVIARLAEAMAGQRRIPDTVDQVRVLYPFLAGDPTVSQLVTQARDRALLQLKLDTADAHEIGALLERVERWIDQHAIRTYVVAERSGPRRAEVEARIRDRIVWRLRAEAHAIGVPLEPAALARLDRALARPAPAVSPRAVEALTARFLRSDECAVKLPELEQEGMPHSVPRVAQGVVALGPEFTEPLLQARLAELCEKPQDDPLVEDLLFSLAAPLEIFWQEARAAAKADQVLAALAPAFPGEREAERFRSAVRSAMLDLENDRALLPVAAAPSPGAPAAASGFGVAGSASAVDSVQGSLALRVNGQPVMNRGLSRSAAQNQLKSLVFALALVMLVLSVLFRSPWSGMLATVPTLITLAAVYGGMGLIGVHLDIGTAMLASLILGAGVDYAVHLVVAWRGLPGEDLDAAAARAADRTGPAIWTNAAMVALGFFILTLGEARPLQNVGGLTAAAMIVAAVATFLALPVLARKPGYRRIGDPIELETSEVATRALEARPTGDRDTG